MAINENSKTIKLEDLGYNNYFESSRPKVKLDGSSVARVVAEYKGTYRVKNETGEYLAKITGKQRFNASSREDYPAVGDWVQITVLNKEQATILEILPRRTIIKRKYPDKSGSQIIATNIDVALVTESVNRDFNLNRLERYFAIANNEGVKAAIVLNKIDLISQQDLDSKLTQIKNRLANVDVITTSTESLKGLDELKKYIEKGQTYCFLGSSGVGKSSLINKLLGEGTIKTGGIGPSSGRGKHITTTREMYFLDNGGIVIDNPGMREVGMTDTSSGVDNLFDEINVLAKKCKFADCSHSNEPGCAVLAALKSNQLDKSKYSNYIRLKKETKHYGMNEYQKKEKKRQFGKLVRRANKDLQEFGHKNW